MWDLGCEFWTTANYANKKPTGYFASYSNIYALILESAAACDEEDR